MIEWNAIVIHHSLTPDGEAADWQGIRRYHTSHKHEGRIVTPVEAAKLMKAGRKVEPPWTDVGYHACVERVNSVPEVLIGRGLHRHGSHTSQQGMNRTGIGFMFAGNFDLAPPDDELLRVAIERFILPMMMTFGIPLSGIRRHSEFAGYKSCPGKLFPWDRFCQIIATAIDLNHQENGGSPWGDLRKT